MEQIRVFYARAEISSFLRLFFYVHLFSLTVISKYVIRENSSLKRKIKPLEVCIITKQTVNCLFKKRQLGQSLRLKNYSNSTFLCWTKSPLFYCSRRKKRQFIRIILLVENCLNDEFYRSNVSHYEFKIQSLTWTLHRSSKNVQPAGTSLMNLAS